MHATRSMLQGTAFLSKAVEQGAVVYLTEQSRANFFNNYLVPNGMDKDDNLQLLFGYQATGVPWSAIAQKAITRCVDVGAKVLVIDSFMRFSGLNEGQENDSSVIQNRLLPLQDAADEHSLLIVIIHHDKKYGSQDIFTSGRGASGFQGAVDQIYLLRRPQGSHPPTMRELQSIGRYDEVPEKLMIELVDGQYVSRGTERNVRFQDAKKFVKENCPLDEADAMTVNDLAALAKDENASFGERTLREALSHLAHIGLLKCLGEGKAGNPFRYYRPP